MRLCNEYQLPENENAVSGESITKYMESMGSERKN